MIAPPLGTLHDAAGMATAEPRQLAQGRALCRLDSAGRILHLWDAVVCRRPWFDPGKEHLAVLSLGPDLELRAWHVAAVGGACEAAVSLPDVFRPALLAGASGIMLAHNHPSGRLIPSAPDVEMTLAAVEAGKLLGLPVLDHVIFGEGSLSLRDCAVRGMEPFRKVAGWRKLVKAWEVSREKVEPGNVVQFVRRA